MTVIIDARDLRAPIVLSMDERGEPIELTEVDTSKTRKAGTKTTAAIGGLLAVADENKNSQELRSAAVQQLAGLAGGRSTRTSTRTPMNDLIPTSRRGR